MKILFENFKWPKNTLSEALNSILSGIPSRHLWYKFCPLWFIKLRMLGETWIITLLVFNLL